VGIAQLKEREIKESQEKERVKRVKRKKERKKESKAHHVEPRTTAIQSPSWTRRRSRCWTRLQ
jgi:hypothetical protein